MLSKVDIEVDVVAALKASRISSYNQAVGCVRSELKGKCSMIQSPSIPQNLPQFHRMCVGLGKFIPSRWNLESGYAPLVCVM